MTLSRFLRDYLYVPLGGNRRGAGRRYVNLMLTVVLAWVYFRSDSLAHANTIVSAMMGANDVTLPYRWLDKLGAAGTWLSAQGVVFQNTPVFGGGPQLNWLVFCALIVWLAPNTQQLMRGYQPALGVDDHCSAGGLRWKPARHWLAAVVALAACGILSLSALSEFIYFQF